MELVVDIPREVQEHITCVIGPGGQTIRWISKEAGVKFIQISNATPGDGGKRHALYTETDLAGRRRRVAKDQHVRDAEVEEALNFVGVGVAHVAAGRELRVHHRGLGRRSPGDDLG